MQSPAVKWGEAKNAQVSMIIAKRYDIKPGQV